MTSVPEPPMMRSEPAPAVTVNGETRLGIPRSTLGWITAQRIRPSTSGSIRVNSEGPADMFAECQGAVGSATLDGGNHALRFANCGSHRGGARGVRIDGRSVVLDGDDATHWRERRVQPSHAVCTW